MILKLLLFLLAVCVLATPVPPPGQVYVPWTPEPNTRGTFSIICTCGVTLGLCVWTAIHPDVMVDGTPNQRFKRKLEMSFKALVMPEDILTAARMQWGHARQLHRALIAAGFIMQNMDQRQKRFSKTRIHADTSEKSGDMPESTKSPNVHRQASPEQTDHTIERSLPERLFFRVAAWAKRSIEEPITRLFNNYILAPSAEFLERWGWGVSRAPLSMQVAYFVVMGGFIRSDDRTRITCEDFYRAFVKDPEGLISQVKLKDIVDKGNASLLAKMIVCFQGGWFVLQLIGRRVAHLPLAFLEIHVSIHILIAAVIYGMWWNKQLDVNEPIELQIEGNNENPNEFWWAAPSYAVRPRHGLGRFIWRLWLLPPQKPDHVFINSFWAMAEGEITAIRSPNPSNGPNHRTVINKGCRGCRHGERITGIFHITTMPLEKKEGDGEDEPLPIVAPQLSPKEDIGNQIIRTTPLRKDNIPQSVDNNQESDNQMKEDLTIEHARARDIRMRSVFACVFYILYSGLHATAWNSYFPSEIERWVWRGSCLVVGSVPLALLLLAGLAILIKKLKVDHDAKKLRDSQWYLGYILWIIYLVAAGSLLLESFVSLRSSLSGVYQKVAWAAYLPHI